MSPKLSSVMETAVKEAMQVVVDLNKHGNQAGKGGANKIASKHWQTRWPDFPQRDGFALADWFRP